MRPGPALRRAFIAFALACAGCSGAGAPDHDDPLHAMAIAYVRRPLAGGFAIDGNFSLPPVAANRGWYASWYTYTGALTQLLPDPAYVQVGMIRPPLQPKTLAAFVAFRTKGGQAHLKTLAGLPPGPHHLRLALESGTISYSIDGRVLYRMPNATLFAPGASDTYLQVGQELSRPNDTARGTISAVRFVAPGQPTENPFATPKGTCFFFSNGISLEIADDRLEARGRFDPGVDDTSACG